MSTTESTEDDENSTEKRYVVVLKPEYQYQHDRTEWVTSDSIEVRDGLVIFGGDEPDRIFDAGEVLDIKPMSV